jgi:hypothetical protein
VRFLQDGPISQGHHPEENEGKSQDSAIQTETRETGSESRKQIIIHNRGAPVILEFGYEPGQSHEAVTT